MGYWAKDGSYVQNELDEQPKMTDHEKWERSDDINARRQQADKDRIRQEENDREFRNWVSETDRLITQKKVEREKAVRKSAEDLNYEQDPMLWLRNPRNLDERRARANYWRLNSTWSVLISKINGKGKIFENLWEKYSHAQSEEEKQMIVEQMEKLYPTTQARLDAASKQEGRSR